MSWCTAIVPMVTGQIAAFKSRSIVVGSARVMSRQISSFYSSVLYIYLFLYHINALRPLVGIQYNIFPFYVFGLTLKRRV